MFLILRVDGLLPLAEAGQRVVSMMRDGQVFLQWSHPPHGQNTGQYQSNIWPVVNLSQYHLTYNQFFLNCERSVK